MKDFKTYEEQLGILVSRGLQVPTGVHPGKVLTQENYYNVINGYKDLFIDETKIDEKYKKGSKFSEIVELYKFDKEIRMILLSRMLKIENTLRSLIAYNFSKEYGNDNYLKFSCFESLVGTGAKQDTINERICHIHELIASIQKTIAGSITKKDYIRHYISKYGFVPLWVLVNVLSFGTLSKFYDLMYQKDRISVAKHYNVKESDLSQFIKIMSTHRNSCAHDERLYNVRLGKTYSMPDTVWHSKLNIPKVNGRYIYGKNDLFSLIIILKILLPNKEFKQLYFELNCQIKNLSKKLVSISINDVYEVMGFPLNWREIR